MDSNQKAVRERAEATLTRAAKSVANANAVDMVAEKKYPVPEVAKILGIAEKTVRKKILEGELGVYRIGTCVRVGENELRRVLEQGFTPARNVA
jgi:excisionase family DNA binding protein